MLNRFCSVSVNDSQSSKRNYPRVAVEIPVILIATAYGTTSVASARSCDMSEGGISIATTTPLREHQSVSLEFKNLEQSVTLKLYGQVKYGVENRYGVQFITPSEQQLKEIRNLLMN